MVCANRSVSFIRELDVFRNKLGIGQGPGIFEVASENELRWNLKKFFLTSQPAEADDDGSDGR